LSTLLKIKSCCNSNIWLEWFFIVKLLWEKEMVKKLKTKTSERQAALSRAVDSSRLIWLAGLGAFSKVETESSALFESLVKEGEKFENQTKKMADNKIDDVKGKVEEVRDKAIDTWDKLEESFEARLASLLNKMGIPTHDDVADLSKRVEALNESVKDLNKV
jgi:poly(hydroxyalkanoate) granule-associated protein